MVAILKFSGRHWARSAVAWLFFVLIVQGLSDAGAKSTESQIAAHNAAVALGILTVSERIRPQSTYQVAKVDLVALDLKTLNPSAFGDRADNEPAH